jgi:GTPase SAR1 family protein
LSKWIDNVREVRGDEALILIVGNKSDLAEERVVQTNIASDEFKKLELFFMEVSAKTGSNVKEFFKDLAFMTGGGKKSREEPTPKQKSNSNPAAPANVIPVAGNFNLNSSDQRDPEKKKKGCC